jgi:hypothetical protein
MQMKVTEKSVYWEEDMYNECIAVTSVTAISEDQIVCLMVMCVKGFG